MDIKEFIEKTIEITDDYKIKWYETQQELDEIYKFKTELFTNLSSEVSIKIINFKDDTFDLIVNEKSLREMIKIDRNIVEIIVPKDNPPLLDTLFNSAMINAKRNYAEIEKRQKEQELSSFFDDLTESMTNFENENSNKQK